MKRLARRAGCLLLAVCLLSGCAALLERSYSVVEPYADRYWDSGEEDTLRVETYQDLVNALVLLITERAEEGVIRCYGEVGELRRVMAAREEVRTETVEGSYLLRDLRLSPESGTTYSTVTCYMTYREDAEDLDSIMTLSDTQSLVDLLRLAVREELEKQTARFSYDTPREDVTAAVESLWQELCRAEIEAAAAAEEAASAGEGAADGQPEDGSGDAETPDGARGEDAVQALSEEPEEALPAEASEEAPADDPENPEEAPAGEPEEPVDYPPCPWVVRFYPDRETAEVVEVVLRS